MTKFAAALHITVLPINRFLSKKRWNEGSSDIHYKDYLLVEKYRLLK
jgi:hypothetical protein